MLISIEPPQLRANQDDARHATWLESLYDLVFAVTVFGLADRMIDDPTLGGYVRFGFLFLVLWWAWVGPTIYLTRFDTNDSIHQAITFLQMFAAAVLTTQIPYVFEQKATIFILSFLFVRYSLLFMYGRARWYLPEARGLTTVYLLGFGTGAALWTLSLFFAPPVQYVLWITGLAIDFATPWVGLRVLQQVPVDTSHLPERFAQFNLIMFGESVYEIIIGIGDVEWRAATVGAAVLLFCLIVATAGRYFVYTDRRSDMIKRNLGPGLGQANGHLTFALGIATISAAAPKVIAEAANASLTLPTLWLLVGGAALCSLAGIFLYIASADAPQRSHIIHDITMVCATLLVGVVGIWLPPLVALVGVLGVALVSFAFVPRSQR